MTAGQILKGRARRAMNGNYGIAISAMVITTGLSLAASMVTTLFFQGTGIVDIILSNVFAFVLNLIVNIFAAGVSYLYLNIARGKEAGISDMLYFFKNHPDRVIVATFVLSLMNLVTNLPLSIYSFTTEVGTSIEAQMEWLTTTYILMLAGLVLYQILVIPFEMSYFLLADNHEMNGMEALKTSAAMMKHNWLRLLLLKVSFVPLMMLSVLTMFIAMLWIVPYMEMTYAMFYRDLSGEFNPPAENMIQE